MVRSRTGMDLALAISMAVFAFLPTLPPVMRMVVRRFSKTKALDISGIGWRWSMQTWGLTLLSWIFIGCFIDGDRRFDAQCGDQSIGQCVDRFGG